MKDVKGLKVYQVDDVFICIRTGNCDQKLNYGMVTICIET